MLVNGIIPDRPPYCLIVSRYLYPLCKKKSGHEEHPMITDKHVSGRRGSLGNLGVIRSQMHIDMNDGPTVGISFSLSRRIVGIDAGTMADTREESNHN